MLKGQVADVYLTGEMLHVSFSSPILFSLSFDSILILRHEPSNLARCFSCCFRRSTRHDMSVLTKVSRRNITLTSGLDQVDTQTLSVATFPFLQRSYGASLIKLEAKKMWK